MSNVEETIAIGGYRLTMIDRFDFPCQGGQLAFVNPEFPPVGGEAHNVWMEAKAHEMSFVMAAATYGDGYRLVDYFRELAAQWKGWDDRMTWYDDGVRVIMTAVHDKRASVSLTVECRTDEPVTITDDLLGVSAWRAGLTVALSPGALPDIAEGIAALLGPSNNPNPPDAR